LALHAINKNKVPQQSALFEPLYVRPPEAEVKYRHQK